MKLEYAEMILAPLITEKSTALKDKQRLLCFKVHRDANKIMVKKAVEELFKTKVRVGAHPQLPGQGKTARPLCGTPGRLEEGLRQAEPRGQDDRIRRGDLMGIKTFNPVTPGLRGRAGYTFEELTTDKPYRKLLVSLHKSGGRNNMGRIAVRHHGGGHKRKYRIIDFRRDKLEIPGVIETIEYDPNRTPRIALVKYRDGDRRYILAPLGVKVGDAVLSTDGETEILPGNALLIKNIPVGTNIHNVEMSPKRGGQTGPHRRRLRHADGQGKRVRAAEDALGRIAQDPYQLPGDHRPAGQRRADQHQGRQGGPHPLAGLAPARARHGHEPRSTTPWAAARARPRAAGTR